MVNTIVWTLRGIRGFQKDAQITGGNNWWYIYIIDTLGAVRKPLMNYRTAYVIICKTHM